MSCLIAAPCSGSGKTLLSLCLAAWVRERGETLQPFKVGPDYLDPQLLGAVAGRPCRNLDPLLCGEEWLARSFQWHGSRADRVLVEGVMGLFDGRGPGSEGSSAAVAAQLGLPVVLVVEASRQGGSLAALVRGFRDHGPPPVRLAGVVLNRVGSARHRALLAEALAAIGVPLLGMLPPDPTLELPSRHLGLLPAAELPDLEARRGRWAALAREHLDLGALAALLAPPEAPSADRQDPVVWRLAAAGPTEVGVTANPAPARTDERLPVAVAADAAFHFRYPELDEFLRGVGLEPLPWSPLADEPLPPGCRAVLLPGGYPELHAERLSRCRRGLGELRRAAAAGLPIVAECGGLLLLGRQLADPAGRSWPMAGLLPFTARRGALSLGYREAETLRDGLLLVRGERLRGHEFHRWQLSCGSGRGGGIDAGHGLWEVEGWGVPRRIEGWTGPTLHASWLHLHWAGCARVPERLAAAATRARPLPPDRTAALPERPRLPRTGGAAPRPRR